MSSDENCLDDVRGQQRKAQDPAYVAVRDALGIADLTDRGAARRRREHATTASAFVPLSFATGEAYQFDWSHEVVILNGVAIGLYAVFHLILGLSLPKGPIPI